MEKNNMQKDGLKSEEVQEKIASLESDIAKLREIEKSLERYAAVRQYKKNCEEIEELSANIKRVKEEKKQWCEHKYWKLVDKDANPTWPCLCECLDCGKKEMLIPSEISERLIEEQIIENSSDNVKVFVKKTKDN